MQTPQRRLGVVYLLEKGSSEVTVTLVFSRETVTESPRLPALPPATLMRLGKRAKEPGMGLEKLLP
jgi:hypothetical protein